MLREGWEGEHFIRGIKRSKEEQHYEALKVMGILTHAKRRANKAGQSRSNNAWARSIHNAAINATIRGKYDDNS